MSGNNTMMTTQSVGDINIGHVVKNNKIQNYVVFTLEKDETITRVNTKYLHFALNIN